VFLLEKKNSRRLVRTSNSSTINEGKLSVAKTIAELKDGDLDAQSYIDSDMYKDDKGLQELTKEVCSLLGAEPKDVFGIDQYVEGDLYDTYEAMKSKFRGKWLTDLVSATEEDIVSFDQAKNIISVGTKYDDFEIFWFTAKSKF
jgi:hypothetical protein